MQAGTITIYFLLSLENHPGTNPGLRALCTSALLRELSDVSACVYARAMSQGGPAVC